MMSCTVNFSVEDAVIDALEDGLNPSEVKELLFRQLDILSNLEEAIQVGVGGNVGQTVRTED